MVGYPQEPTNGRLYPSLRMTVNEPFCPKISASVPSASPPGPTGRWPTVLPRRSGPVCPSSASAPFTPTAGSVPPWGNCSPSLPDNRPRKTARSPAFLSKNTVTPLTNGETYAIIQKIESTKPMIEKSTLSGSSERAAGCVIAAGEGLGNGLMRAERTEQSQ